MPIEVKIIETKKQNGGLPGAMKWRKWGINRYRVLFVQNYRDLEMDGSDGHTTL